MKIEYEYSTTPEELLRLFEREHGSLEKLRRKVRAGKAKFAEKAALDEWEHYASRPPGMTVRVRRAAVFHDSREFFKFLTPERLRVLDALRSGSYESLHELAKALGRDPKNVYEDVKALESESLVRVEKRNARRSVPKARVEKIHITM